MLDLRRTTDILIRHLAVKPRRRKEKRVCAVVPEKSPQIAVKRNQTNVRDVRLIQDDTNVSHDPASRLPLGWRMCRPLARNAWDACCGQA
jgi:hypothetical protein